MRPAAVEYKAGVIAPGYRKRQAALTTPWKKVPMKILKYLGVLLKEFGEFAWHNKAWWIVPVVLILLLLSVLIFAGSSAAPFIYTLF